MDKPDHIKQLFSETFADYANAPGADSWKKINRKLAFHNFLKFNPLQFNVWYAGALLTAVALFGFINPNETQKSDKMPQANVVKDFDNEEDTLIYQNKSHTEQLVAKPSQAKEKEIYAKPKHKNAAISKIEIVSEISCYDILPTVQQNSGLDIPVFLKDKKPNLAIDFLMDTSNICAPAKIRFSCLPGQCNQLVWDFGNGKVSKENNPTVHYSTPGIYTVKLTGYKDDKSVSISKRIVVHESAKASFVVANDEKLFVNTPINFINGKTFGNNCKWLINNEFKSSSVNNFSYAFESPGFYNICLISISANGCRDTFIMNNLQIKEKEYEISVPNALCLNRNGAQSGYWKMNAPGVSVFHPIISPNPECYELNIYNKFGERIFVSKDYAYGWNGYHNNAALPQGVYVWECRGKFSNGKTFLKKGSITLLHANQ